MKTIEVGLKDRNCPFYFEDDISFSGYCNLLSDSFSCDHGKEYGNICNACPILKHGQILIKFKEEV